MAHSGSLCSPQRDEIMIVIVIKKSLRDLSITRTGAIEKDRPWLIFPPK
jgi:hypothetical protein